MTFLTRALLRAAPSVRSVSTTQPMLVARVLYPALSTPQRWFAGEISRSNLPFGKVHRPSAPLNSEIETRTPEELIAAVKPIPVQGDVAKCDGGGAALGHPVTYIKLDPISTTPIGETPVGCCEYCGLRFYDATRFDEPVGESMDLHYTNK